MGLDDPKWWKGRPQTRVMMFGWGAWSRKGDQRSRAPLANETAKSFEALVCINFPHFIGKETETPRLGKGRAGI